ncbi:MAG TPA: histidine kinase dimerization/phospho-acceptor domain-containing protein, partial [Polyangiaceae bacterium]|nr:histidine kinase dimerization/phospho-acceptor domain-containing protein [Polyangiaceae bacterium]
MKPRDLSMLGYRRIVILLVALVVVPSFSLLTVGAVLLFLGEAQVNILMGILVISLSGAAATGVILVWVFVRREANLSALQSDFVSKVSHELRTPLTSIRLFTETLALRRGDPVAEE